MYESFVAYQSRIITQFDQMVEDYGFRVIDASCSIEGVLADLKEQVLDVLNNGHTASVEPIERLKHGQNGHMTRDILRGDDVEGGLVHINAGLRVD